MVNKGYWTYVIKAQTSWFDLKLAQLWSYRDLIFIFVKRDFSTAYKQTILGPFWHLLQPLVSAFFYAFIFSYIGKISHGEMPSVLFYLSGIVPFSYFSDCITRSSGIFFANAALFGKVYFPRLVAPLAVAMSNLIKFAIQLFLFLVIWFIFLYRLDNVIYPNIYILLLPFLLVIMALLGLGMGLIVSSMTIRYRDLANFLGYGVQVLMYASPIILPESIWPENVQWIVNINPITPVVNTFRYGFLGVGSLDIIHLLYSFAFSSFVFLLGIIIFNRVEKSFIDKI